MSAEFIASRSFQTDHRGPLRFIFSHISRHPMAGLLMVFGAFSNAALASAISYLTGVAFNGIVNNADLRLAARVGLAIIAAQLLRAVLQLVRNASSEVFAQRIERDVRDELYANLLGKSMAFHDGQAVGEIMARVTNDVREMNLMMNPALNLLIGSGFFLLVPMIAVPLSLHPLLAVPPTLFVVVYLWLQFKYLRWLNPIAQEVRTRFGGMNAHLAEALDGVQVVKGAAREDSESRNFNRLVDDVRDFSIKQGYTEAMYLPLLWLNIMFGFGFAYAIYLYLHGIIDVGTIVAFMGMMSLFGFPTYSSMRSISMAASGYASASRILKIITTQTHVDENKSGYHETMHGAIRFEHATFGYGEGEAVLRDVSFEVKLGQIVAIVGQTGAGKTTLTKLINRSYDVQGGRVLVDGVDVREWNLEALRSQISVIEQDIYLFSRSITNNVRFGKQIATQDEVEAVAQQAQAHEFITSFPEGYETVVGQRGVTLSGGQRQRLAIARSFLTDPPIMILDDSTSAIDSATEDRIQQAIWTASKGRTTILITHRLSQIRWADHIVVLRRGQVAAQGTHEQLMEQSESYRRIFARYETPTTQRDRKG